MNLYNLGTRDNPKFAVPIEVDTPVVLIANMYDDRYTNAHMILKGVQSGQVVGMTFMTTVPHEIPVGNFRIEKDGTVDLQSKTIFDFFYVGDMNKRITVSICSQHENKDHSVIIEFDDGRYEIRKIVECVIGENDKLPYKMEIK